METPKEIKIGTHLTCYQKAKLIELLRAYLDVFSWSYDEMSRLNTLIVEHRLPIDLAIRAIKQKLRRLHPEWSLKIKEEIIKQFNVGFLWVVEYPQWLANIVPVPKNDGKVRMCINYWDLNKESPKDNFSLPHIDILVDNTAGHEIFSFMDSLSRYNEIRISPEDQSKTAFLTPWGVFCYQVMSFSLKNTWQPIRKRWS